MKPIKLNSWEGPSIVEMQIYQPPKIAGYLVIAKGFKASANEKPTAEHLANMKETFGWEWEDA